MIVTHVWDAEYPWDVRVEKISRALVADGHRVEIVARNRDRRETLETLPEGTVHRFAWWSWTSPGLNALTQFPAFFNPRWLGLIDRTVRASGSNVLLCRDLPLAPAAIRVAKARGIPMVLDMAENYPAMIQDIWRFGSPRLWDGLVRNPGLARAVERWVVRNADHILVVVEESRSRVVKLGVPPDRVTVVSNTPPRDELGPFPERRRGTGELLELVYVGQLDSPLRGVDVLLKAVAKCNDRGPRVRVTVVGDGRERASLVALAGRLHLEPNAVRFAGRLPHREALGMLADAHVGVVLHLSTEHTDTTVANKLFDYMAAGLAVLASSARPMARIVGESACGEVASSGDIDGTVIAIDRLSDDDHRHRCAVAGWQAVATTYNWKNDVNRLRTALEAATQTRPSGTPE